ncbi:MAG: hypothetical protein R3359_11275 [Marinirhabdus sp.]|nr:hypothetical protein [Marinirhabdus sp.]
MKTIYKLSIAIFLFIPWVSSAQTDDTTNQEKGAFFVRSFFGIGTLEAEDVFKVNANVSGGTIGKEFILSDLFSISVAIESLRARADYATAASGTNFLSNNYLQFPVKATIREQIGDQLSLTVSVGSLVSYLYASRVENVLLNLDEKETGLGTNFAVGADIFMKYYLNDAISFMLGLRTQADTFSISDGGSQEFSLTDVYAFELGVGFVL